MSSEVSRRRFLETTGTAALLGAGTVVAAGPAERKEAAAGPIKILGVSCSPRKGKTTTAAMRICLDAAKAADGRIEVELIELAGLRDPRRSGGRGRVGAGRTG